jgi:CheY-like chemotaxis protein
VSRDENLNQLQSSHLEGAQQSVVRAAELVKRLLTFSRKAELLPTQVDLNQIVAQAAEILERAIPKMVKIEIDTDPDLWPINADPNQLEQVVMNLGTNARDAMPGGGVLTFATRNLRALSNRDQSPNDLPPGRYVQLIVRDTGHGMDRETLAHIFDPFFTTKEVGKGTGLGLFTVYGIVQSHQGKVSCQSRPGQGSEFTITIPVGQPPQEQNTQKKDEDKYEQGGQETVLLVDDERSIREVGRGILESFGYKVYLADSGEQALNIYRENGKSIDLVVLDLGMPGMGGLKCLHELLVLDPAAKVIIASGYSQQYQTQQMLEAGAQAYLAKPYRLQSLLQNVREVLDR